MKQDDFKKLLDEAIEPLKSSIDVIKKTQVKQAKDLQSIKKTQGKHSETLATLSSSVVNIETTNAVYGDMYKINNDNARKLEKRVITLEDSADIEPPPELTLLKVQ